jgi:hypothetical protein
MGFNYTKPLPQHTCYCDMLTAERLGSYWVVVVVVVNLIVPAGSSSMHATTAKTICYITVPAV